MIEVKRMKTENAWKKYADKKPVFDFCEGYKEFMSLCKTERECTRSEEHTSELSHIEESRMPSSA